MAFDTTDLTFLILHGNNLFGFRFFLKSLRPDAAWWRDEFDIYEANCAYLPKHRRSPGWERRANTFASSAQIKNVQS